MSRIFRVPDQDKVQYEVEFQNFDNNRTEIYNWWEKNFLFSAVKFLLNRKISKPRIKKVSCKNIFFLDLFPINLYFYKIYKHKKKILGFSSFVFY